jgi:hypothetical protein
MNGIERMPPGMKQAAGVLVLALFFLSPAAMAGPQESWDTPFAGSGAGLRHLRLMHPPEGHAPAVQPHVGDPEQTSHSLGTRLLVEGLAGAGASIVLGLAGAGLGLLMARDNDYYGLSVLFGGVLGAGIGFPFGVWGGGEWMGGDGSLLATVGGYALGGVGLVGTNALGATLRDPGSRLIMGAGVLLPITGALLGYELSSGFRKRAKLQVQPVVALSADRQMFGLAGRF